MQRLQGGGPHTVNKKGAMTYERKEKDATGQDWPRPDRNINLDP